MIDVVLWGYDRWIFYMGLIWGKLDSFKFYFVMAYRI